jgi:hypothetical protein
VKTTIVALLMLVLTVSVFAQAPAPIGETTDLTFGVTFDKTSTDKSGNAAFDLAIPLTRHIQVGPSVNLTYYKPNDGHATNIWSLGGLAYLNLFNGYSGPFVGAKALYNVQDANGYLVVPVAGVKFGGAKWLVQVDAEHPFHYDKGVKNRVDLESTQFIAACGLRF